MNKNVQEILNIMESFNQKYEVYICEKPKDSVYYHILIGCVTEIIVSKKVFKGNKEVVEFLDTTMKVTFPNYVGKNRSLILGRTIKHLSQIDSVGQIKDILNKMYNFMNRALSDESNEVKDWRDAIDSMNLR